MVGCITVVITTIVSHLFVVSQITQQDFPLPIAMPLLIIHVSFNTVNTTVVPDESGQILPIGVLIGRLIDKQTVSDLPMSTYLKIVSFVIFGFLTVVMTIMVSHIFAVSHTSQQDEPFPTVKPVLITHVSFNTSNLTAVPAKSGQILRIGAVRERLKGKQTVSTLPISTVLNIVSRFVVIFTFVIIILVSQLPSVSHITQQLFDTPKLRAVITTHVSPNFV